MEKQGDRFATIVNTDIEGLSDLLKRQGSRGLGMLKLYNQLIKETGESKGGRIVKNLGSSIILEFPGIPEAVSFALKVQNTAQSSESAEYPEIPIRIGIHYGEIYRYENDMLGDGISVASGLKSFCSPGNIAVSNEVKTTIASRIEYAVESRGMRHLEGVTGEIDTYEIVVNSSGAAAGEINDRSSYNEPVYNAETSRRSEQAGSEKYPVDIEELKNLILDNIKMAGKKLDVEKLRRSIPIKSRDLDRLLDGLTERGYLNRGTDSSGHVGYGLNEKIGDMDWREERDYWKQYAREWKHHYRGRRHAQRRYRDMGDDLELRDDYRELALENGERAKGGFRGHLIPFITVNAFLFFIWAMTGGGHPWFLYPLGGWGIGLVSHYATMKRRVRGSRCT